MLFFVAITCGSHLLFARSGTGQLNYELSGGFSNLGLQVDGVIRGKVVNENGDPLPGATITLMESNKTVAANDKGEFEITNVNAGRYRLKISSVGYSDRIENVNVETGKGISDLVMNLSAVSDELGEVVVTAFGIRRQARTLTYATQRVTGEQINEVKSGNIANSLAGKVAGMVITQSAGGPGSSARILLRGNRSIGGDNGALIVVDGAIIDNNLGGQTGSDGISSINPDDVETINVLKGSAATALYGTKGANGVILISTKKGKPGKLITNFNTGATLDNPLLSPDVQNEYGQGTGGVFNANSPSSWGPRIAGQQVTDWTGKQATLAAQPDNLKEFFRNAFSLNNSIGISGGTDITQTYFSYGNTFSEGIVPENKLNRHSVNLRVASKLGKRFSTDVKVTYVQQDIDNKPGVGGGSAPINIYKIPRTVNIEDVKNYETEYAPGLFKPNYWYVSQFFGNPYWTVYNTKNTERRDRIFGLISGKYQVTKWLDVKAVISIDLSNDKGFYSANAGTPGSAGSDNGSFGESMGRSLQRNMDLVVSGQNSLGRDFKISYNVGGTVLDNRGDFVAVSVRKLITPNRFNVAFSNQADEYPANASTRIQRQAIFGTAQFSFRDYLYLDATARQEYFSTLPSPYYSFYPSAGLNAILSDIIKMPSIVDYAKIRAGYARTGGGGPAYLNKQTYVIYPDGGVQRNVVSPFPDLKPELTAGWEAGTELRFFKNRFNVDFTWYKSNTTNQLISVPTPPATGFASQYINAGNIQNSGVEVVLGLVPLKGALTWNIVLNFARNKNEVLSILPGKDEVQLDINFADFIKPVAKVGGAFGDIYAYGWKRRASGEYIVDNLGKPVRTPDLVRLGNYNPDFTLSLGNTFSYKNFTFNFLVDGRFGGEMISGTDAVMASDGTPAYTGSHRDSGTWLLPAVQEDGSKNTSSINAETFWTTVTGPNGVSPWSEVFVYDGTNVRLRELAIGYRFKLAPGSVIKDAKLSLVGRNLFFFYRGYAKVDLPGIAKRKANFDSEVNLYNSNLQGLEYGTLPPTRSIGLNLKLSF